MPGEVDPRLMNLLQGVLGLSDCLRDAGVEGALTVSLGREDGLLLLKLSTGASGPEAEEWSQRGRPVKPGVNSLKIARMTFEWPKPEAKSQRPEAARMFSATPAWISTAANDNSLSVLRFYGFEEETPALR